MINQICHSVLTCFLQKVPHTTYRTPVEEDVITKIREENRKRAEVRFKSHEVTQC